MITVQGHRGARGRLPENSLPAFLYAVEAGAHFLELDLVCTKDGIPIIIHDPVVNPALVRWRDGRSIGPFDPIYSHTRAELENLSIGAIRDPDFPQQILHGGLTPPTLAELFMALNNSEHPNAKKIQLNLEVKSVPAGVGILHPGPKDFVGQILQVVKNFGMLDRVLIQSFDHAILTAARKLEKKVRISVLFAENWLDFVGVAKKLKAEYIAPNQYWIQRADVVALHKAGIKVAPWTVNALQDWERMIALGVDSIITDYPAELLEFLSRRGAAKKAKKRRSTRS